MVSISRVLWRCWLKEYGISLEGAFGRSSGNRDELYEINRQAALFFFRAHAFRRSNPGIYIYETPGDQARKLLNEFGIGYADGRVGQSLYDSSDAPWDLQRRQNSLNSDSYRDQDKAADAMINSANRVIFPIHKYEEGKS